MRNAHLPVSNVFSELLQPLVDEFGRIIRTAIIMLPMSKRRNDLSLGSPGGVYDLMRSKVKQLCCHTCMDA
eukprot:scaffold15894_cov37-Prasinocladus_malaysianus.AAC.1